jgi:membrane-bound ClpP family serine protease
MDNLYLAYGLLALGVVLLLIELVLVTAGIAAVLGIGCLIASVAMLFSASALQGFIVMGILLVLVPAITPAILAFWKRTAVGRKMVLEVPDDSDASVNSMRSLQDLERYRGRFGKAVAPLRPSGVVEFDGRRIDSISEGMMIDEGQWVRCIAVQGNRVIVRQVDRPPELEDMDTTSLLDAE